MSPVQQQVAEEPRRFLLRPAGVLTQVCCAAALLLGTIAFVLTQQSKTGGAGYVIAWSIGAMNGLVFGGLMARGGLVSLFVSAAIDATFGVVLLVIDWDTLRKLLRVLPESDVQMIADIVVVAAVVMLVTAALCLASIGQARRYAKAFAQAVSDAVAADPSLAQSFTAMKLPPPSGMFMAVNPPAATDDDRPTDPTTPIIPTAASTNKGWAPHKATGNTTMMIIRKPAEEAASRRRIYIALGGFAIGVGAGIGVLVSSGAKKKTTTDPVVETGSAGSGSATTAPIVMGTSSGGGSGSAGSGGGSAGSGSAGSGSAGSGSAAIATAPTVSIRSLLATQRDAIAKADAKALADTMSMSAFLIGTKGDQLAEGYDAVEKVLADLIAAPPSGYRVESKYLATGGEGAFAWTAEELELSGGGESHRIAITQLAQFLEGKWTVLVAHWGVPVRDSTAERMAILGTLPRAGIVPNKHDGSDELDKAVKTAFSTRRAFADARSEREDGFNFGSGPGERVIGGAAIKRLFGRLRSELKLDGGARVAEVGPNVGWAAVNVVYTSKSQAATDVSQTFRVLAVLVKESGGWKIVQTHFSNAGPIAD